MTDMDLNFGKVVPKAEAGTYPAHLVGIEPFVIDEGTPDAKTLLRWEFSLDGTDDPEQPGFAVILDGVSSTATGKRSKMREWVTAIYGKPLESAVKLSTLRDWLVKRPCVVGVIVNEDGYSKVATVAAALRKPVTPPQTVAALVDTGDTKEAARLLQEQTDRAELQHAIQEGDPLPR